MVKEVIVWHVSRREVEAGREEREECRNRGVWVVLTAIPIY
jgi:hypothetical protein